VGLAELQAELPRLLDGRIEVVSALAELFAAADADGQPDISRLAERMVWHEMGDAEVLYPAAVLFGSTVRAILTGVDGAVAPSDAEALH
ncbi:hypothetical protein, partial [uncultured Amaricoccus sp.]|uniref:hypothetical protein n=1 Tax=uncultured Amaricoccus sp. TaxID=339341 RepID=UPI002628E75C